MKEIPADSVIQMLAKAALAAADGGKLGKDVGDNLSNMYLIGQNFFRQFGTGTDDPNQIETRNNPLALALSVAVYGYCQFTNKNEAYPVVVVVLGALLDAGLIVPTFEVEQLPLPDADEPTDDTDDFESLSQSLL
jgi:hypothetical protein